MKWNKMHRIVGKSASQLSMILDWFGSFLQCLIFWGKIWAWHVWNSLNWHSCIVVLNHGPLFIYILLYQFISFIQISSGVMIAMGIVVIFSKTYICLNVKGKIKTMLEDNTATTGQISLWVWDWINPKSTAGLRPSLSWLCTPQTFLHVHVLLQV